MDLPDAFGAAVEKWIEGHVRAGPLEAHLIDLREALPHLYDALVETLFASED
jgi:hypothetical protein